MDIHLVVPLGPSDEALKERGGLDPDSVLSNRDLGPLGTEAEEGQLDAAEDRIKELVFVKSGLRGP